MREIPIVSTQPRCFHKRVRALPGGSFHYVEWCTECGAIRKLTADVWGLWCGWELPRLAREGKPA